MTCMQARAGAAVVHAPALQRGARRDPPLRRRLHRALLHHVRALAPPDLLRLCMSLCCVVLGCLGGGTRIESHNLYTDITQGFLMCVFFILMATCAEITIVMIYFQVRPPVHTQGSTANHPMILIHTIPPTHHTQHNTTALQRGLPLVVALLPLLWLRGLLSLRLLHLVRFHVD